MELVNIFKVLCCCCAQREIPDCKTLRAIVQSKTQRLTYITDYIYNPRTARPVCVCV